MNDVVRSPGGSRALQGCLTGAVVLFAALLIALLVIGFLRFQEFTAPGAEPGRMPVPQGQSLEDPRSPVSPLAPSPVSNAIFTRVSA